MVDHNHGKRLELDGAHAKRWFWAPNLYARVPRERGHCDGAHHGHKMTVGARGSTGDEEIRCRGEELNAAMTRASEGRK
jgi:hypothetical protein